jgi:enoyl-CoA hydratase
MNPTNAEVAMQNVSVVTNDRIAIVTLDRPPVNALDTTTFAELAQAFTDLSSGRDASVAILRASPEARLFCGGVDLQDSPRRHRPDGRFEDGGPQGDARHQIDPGRAVRDCFWAIYDCGIPVIAAVDGKCIGAGVAVVGSCDMVVATNRASFALTEINVGVLGGARHAQRLVGPFLAKRMFLTGDFIEADELYRRGAIEFVVEPGDLMATATGIAAKIATKSPIAVRLGKESANRVEALSLQDGYRLEQDYTGRVKRHADADEARLAFFEKRAPSFQWE